MDIGYCFPCFIFCTSRLSALHIRFSTKKHLSSLVTFKNNALSQYLVYFCMTGSEFVKYTISKWWYTYYFYIILICISLISSMNTENISCTCEFSTYKFLYKASDQVTFHNSDQFCIFQDSLPASFLSFAIYCDHMLIILHTFVPVTAEITFILHRTVEISL